MKSLISSVWAEVALILAIFGNVLLLVAFIGIGWGIPRDPGLNPEYEGVGLWRLCRRKNEGDVKVYCENLMSRSDLPGWFRSVQALVSTSLVGLYITFGLICAFACIQRFHSNRILLLIYSIATLTFDVIGLTGVITFGMGVGNVKIDGIFLKVSWGFVLASVSLGLHFLCCIFSLVELIIGQRTETVQSDNQPVINDVAEIATSGSIPMESTA